MKPYEIHYARVVWKGCEDERPWLIVEVLGGGRFGCFPISGQNLGHPHCFEIEADHRDFGATGLTRSCRVHYQSIIELHASDFRRRKGELVNEMLREFLQQSGLD